MAGTTTFYKLPYPLGTDPISDGDDQIKALAEKVEAVTGRWTAYSPTLGGMQLQAGAWFRYRRDGDTVKVAGAGIIGGGTAAIYTVSTPPGLPAYLGGLSEVWPVCGVYSAFDVSANTRFNGWTIHDTAGTQFRFFNEQNANPMAFDTPFVWAIGDHWTFRAEYETTTAPT